MPTVEDEGHVDIDDVARLERALPRDAVADDVVHGRADGFWKATVVQRGRHGLELIDDVLVADAVELLRGDAGAHELADHVEHVGRQAPGYAHFALLFGRLDRHAHNNFEETAGVRRAGTVDPGAARSSATLLPEAHYGIKRAPRRQFADVANTTHTHHNPSAGCRAGYDPRGCGRGRVEDQP